MTSSAGSTGSTGLQQFSSSSAIPAFNIGGLASGLDTTSIINQLMNVEKIPQTRIIQQQTLETTRQTDLRTIQNSLSALSGAVDALRNPSTWTTSQGITSSDPSHVTATGAGVPPGGFQIAVSQLARGQQLTQSTSVTSAAAADQLTIAVGADPANQFTVNVASGATLDTIAAAINSAGGAKVYASVINAKLVLSSQITGAANTISVNSTGGGTLAADLGLNQTVSSQDAQFTVDGVGKTSASNTVTNVATGLALTLLGTTTNAATISVSTPGPNQAAVQTAVQNFVNQYNQTYSLVFSKVNEHPVPLASTDADRAVGDLSGDPSLVSLLSRLRQSVGDLVSGGPAGFQTMAQVGVSTGAAVGSAQLNESSIQGALTLDSNKLTAALTSNFAQVKTLFTNTTGTYGTEGLSQRMNDVLFSFTSPTGVLSSMIKSQSSIISELGAQKSAWDIRLADKQTALQQQFSNMETALQKSQSEGSWLSSQIAKLG